jgi:hypothetical protein
VAAKTAWLSPLDRVGRQRYTTLPKRCVVIEVLHGSSGIDVETYGRAMPTTRNNHFDVPG